MPTATWDSMWKANRIEVEALSQPQKQDGEIFRFRVFVNSKCVAEEKRVTLEREVCLRTVCRQSRGKDSFALETYLEMRVYPSVDRCVRRMRDVLGDLAYAMLRAIERDPTVYEAPLGDLYETITGDGRQSPEQVCELRRKVDAWRSEFLHFSRDNLERQAAIDRATNSVDMSEFDAIEASLLAGTRRVIRCRLSLPDEDDTIEPRDAWRTV